jgi:hypothetical protein
MFPQFCTSVLCCIVTVVGLGTCACKSCVACVPELCVCVGCVFEVDVCAAPVYSVCCMYLMCAVYLCAYVVHSPAWTQLQHRPPHRIPSTPAEGYRRTAVPTRDGKSQLRERLALAVAMTCPVPEGEGVQFR